MDASRTTPIPAASAPRGRSLASRLNISIAVAIALVSVAALISPVQGTQGLSHQAQAADLGNTTVGTFADNKAVELLGDKKKHDDDDDDPSDISLEQQYQWIRQRVGTKSQYPHEDRPKGRLADTPKGYELVQLHLVCRHGSRYPGSKDSASYQKLVEKLRDTDVKGFDWIEDWESKTLYPPTMDKLLAPRGDEDLYSIGNRFAIRYKAFLDKYPYTADTYEFRSSAKSRSSQSAIAFAQGLFRDRVLSSPKKTKRALLKPIAQPIGIFTIPSGLDQEMEIETSCKKWMDDVDDNPAVGKQREDFEERFLPALAVTMSKVFGVKLSTKEVDTIHQLCAFEVALYDDVSTWCQVLLRGSSPDGKIRLGDILGAAPASDSVLRFEIADDLEDFYANGPGIPFNRIMACKLGTSLMESIELALSSDADQSKLFRAHLKFGHSETIMFFSTFLGLYNRDGKPLTGNMTDEQLSSRDFRGSVFSPFSANMAFEVYKPAKDSDEGLVRFLVNEKPFLIPGCDGKSSFCKWSTFKSILTKAGAGCNIDACCAATTKSSVFETLAGTETCPSTSPVA